MVHPLPPLAALRAFVAVARLGSFARAGAELNVSTSAVSHQVRALEGQLGTLLLTRARNGGKGAAVLDGLHAARAAGFTHAIQVDADSQHDSREGNEVTR